MHYLCWGYFSSFARVSFQECNVFPGSKSLCSCFPPPCVFSSLLAGLGAAVVWLCSKPGQCNDPIPCFFFSPLTPIKIYQKKKGGGGGGIILGTHDGKLQQQKAKLKNKTTKKGEISVCEGF